MQSLRRAVRGGGFPMQVPMVPTSVQEVVKAANGLQQVRFTCENSVGSFLLWIGEASYEEAEFVFEFSWRFRESDRDNLIVSFPFNLLGVERVHMLTQDPIHPKMLFWR